MKKRKEIGEELPEFRNDYLHLIIDEKTKLMYSEWIRQPEREEYIEAAGIFARYLQEKDIRYWIQDVNQIKVLYTEDLKVALKQLGPVAAASNLKKLARISTDEQNFITFIRLANETQLQMNSNIEIQHFTTYREAVDWISSV